MTKHSTLANADDLHYAKIRTFTGDPNLIGADFDDQILVSADSNKIYRATTGGLIELTANRPQGEGAGAIFTGQGYPSPNIPRSVGALYFDLDNVMMYICAFDYLEKGWIATQRRLSINGSVNTNESISDIYLSLYYSPNAPYTPFNFSTLVNDNIHLGDPNFGDKIAKLIHSNGLGYYAFGVSYPQELTVNDLFLNINSNPYDILNFGVYGQGMTANDIQIVGKALEFSSYPPNDFECSLTISIGLI